MISSSHLHNIFRELINSGSDWNSVQFICKTTGATEELIEELNKYLFLNKKDYRSFVKLDKEYGITQFLVFPLKGNTVEIEMRSDDAITGQLNIRFISALDNS